MSKYPRKEVGKDVKVPAVAWDSTLEEWRDLLEELASEYAVWVGDQIPDDLDEADAASKSSAGKSSLGKKEGEGWGPATKKCNALAKNVKSHHSFLKNRKVVEVDLALPLADLREKYDPVRKKYQQVAWGCPYCKFESDLRCHDDVCVPIDGVAPNTNISIEDHYQLEHFNHQDAIGAFDKERFIRHEDPL